MRQGVYVPHPCTLLHGASLSGEAKANPNTPAAANKTTPLPGDQAAVLLTSEELSDENTMRRAHTVIPHVGSAYRPTGLSSHPPNHLAFSYYLPDNRYRCLTNNTTDNEQQQGPPVTSGPALSSRQSTRLPTR